MCAWFCSCNAMKWHASVCASMRMGASFTICTSLPRKGSFSVPLVLVPWPATMASGKSLPAMTSSFCEVPPINRVGTSPRVQEKTQLVRGYRSLCLPFPLVHCSSSMFKHCTTFWLQLNLILAKINVVLSDVVQTRLSCQSPTQANPQHPSLLMGEAFRGLNVASSVWGSSTWVRPTHKNSAVWLL